MQPKLLSIKDFRHRRADLSSSSGRTIHTFSHSNGFKSIADTTTYETVSRLKISEYLDALFRTVPRITPPHFHTKYPSSPCTTSRGFFARRTSLPCDMLAAVPWSDDSSVQTDRGSLWAFRTLSIPLLHPANARLLSTFYPHVACPIWPYIPRPPKWFVRSLRVGRDSNVLAYIC